MKSKAVISSGPEHMAISPGGKQTFNKYPPAKEPRWVKNTADARRRLVSYSPAAAVVHAEVVSVSKSNLKLDS